ncbi:rRNA processing/ribosome biogenesis-domain-containing protein [Daldinia decipiens]|uniref:rRNA processing/ribosome biogenesis-domain-containing protein n=1 Tax=Daldinia decipiens TaxID=326647 RepID=UPI0020C3F578|nr:rRNA processing/ribosome biogenesis-domain-containing protein [Daldinia decipiens]KAI1661683.1 rRNA processing/ribosome biogenesis-domain-containing protein [Daldinia decipiens]
MAFSALPPELRSLCRRLTATKVEQLPALLPSLLRDLLRCKEPLSRPHEAKASDSSSESTVLVHKLKTQISTLLNSRTSQGRFVGVALVKAVVETGGWECLRTSEPWVRGLLSILQRKDPAVIKDLCVVTLVKIYTLMHAYPTLIREIVTPTLPTFGTACLQILKPPTTSKVAKAPNSLVETIFEGFSVITPLYPTTLRQFASKLRVETRLYIAPTVSDGTIVPASLQACSRRLVIRLHMTAIKGGDSTEWTKHLDGIITTFHSTADQVFRAIQENWESVSGHPSESTPQRVDFDKDPQGGSDSPDQLPPWTGIYAGSERMLGLLDFICEYLRCFTKTTVTIPVSAMVDIVTRISSITPSIPGKEKSASIQMNPAVGREEKDELWTVFPDIQLAAMKLLFVMTQRLRRSFLPLAQISLEQLLRMFESSYRLPEIRIIAFLLTKEILQLCGPTMEKLTVEGLSLVIKACCRDLLGYGGHLKHPKQSAVSTQSNLKSKSSSQNADAFLGNSAEDESISVSLSPEHVSAATAFLTALFSHVPQQLLPSSLRAHMLKTAILCQIKDAQVASVLHPVRDKSGRTPAVILPYLTQRFPHDESVEVLRFNFRPVATGPRNDAMDIDKTPIEDASEDDSSMNGLSFDQPLETSVPSPTNHTRAEAVETSAKAQDLFLPKRPLETVLRSEEEGTTVARPPPTNLLKRKSEEAEIAISKRVEIDTTATTVISAPIPVSTNLPSQAPKTGSVGAPDEEDSSDNESVHLNMELDADDDDDDDDDGAEEN